MKEEKKKQSPTKEETPEDKKEAPKGESQPNRVNEKRHQEPTAENEIRVAAKGQIKNYLGYAFRILNKTDHKTLKIRATGNAIVKANILIELVKRRVGDLHQLNSIYSMVISSQEEKLGEKIETKRRVTAMDTLLSKEPLDTSDPGYQQPEPKDEPFTGSNKPQGQTKAPQKRDDKKRRGPKLYNAPLGGDSKEESKKDPKKKSDGKDKQEKKDKPLASESKDKKRSRKDKINQPTVKDDEKTKKEKPRRGRGMMPVDRHMMPSGRPMRYNMPMERGYDDRRYRGQMPPYMGGYPPRSYDDFNVRPQRGNRGRRGMQQMDPYRHGPRDHDMYMYGDPYEQMGYGGGYNYYGPPPDRRYPPRQGGPDDGMRGYNAMPRNYNEERQEGPSGAPPYREQRGERPPMRGGPSERGERPRLPPAGDRDRMDRPPMRGGASTERGGRYPDGPPRDQRDTRGPADRDGRDQRDESFEGHRGGYNQYPRDREMRGDPRDNKRGAPMSRDDEGRPPMRGGPGYGRGGPYNPSRRGMPPGRFDEEGHSRFQQPSERGPDSGPQQSMRGARGMRGNRGTVRSALERGEFSHQPRGERGGYASNRGGGEDNGRSDYRRGGRDNDHDRRGPAGDRGEPGSHKIVQKSRGGRGGAGAGPDTEATGTADQ